MRRCSASKIVLVEMQGLLTCLANKVNLRGMRRIVDCSMYRWTLLCSMYAYPGINIRIFLTTRVDGPIRYPNHVLAGMLCNTSNRALGKGARDFVG